VAVRNAVSRSKGSGFCRKLWIPFEVLPKGIMRHLRQSDRDDGKRFVVHADEKLTAFLELESVIKTGQRLACSGWLGGSALGYNGDSRTGSSRRQVHGHDTAHQWVSPDLDHRVFDTGNSLEELRREMLDGIDGYDRRVCVELERCGWRRKVKVAEAVFVHGVEGIVIRLDDADEGSFRDAHGLFKLCSSGKRGGSALISAHPEPGETGRTSNSPK
jgi:hypothetical protein